MTEFKAVAIENSMMEEGRTYPFTVVGYTELGEGESFFVMRDYLGYKMLMHAKHFSHYSFSVGCTIPCRIDKINCNGKIYLEPENPWYRENESYHFSVVGYGKRVNITGLPEVYYIVQDLANRNWTVKMHGELFPAKLPQSVFCQVVRIKKGKMYLRLHGMEEQSNQYSQGATYPFTLLGERADKSLGVSFYILEDSQGNRFSVKKKFFAKYRFKSGSQINCRVDGYNDDGGIFLEPEHPHYIIGNEYAFEIADKLEYCFKDGSRQKYLVLKDIFGEEIKMALKEESANQWADFSSVLCRIIQIRKSRIQLEPISGLV